MHVFTQVPVSDLSKWLIESELETMKRLKLIIVAYQHEDCYQATFAMLQENEDCKWVFPDHVCDNPSTSSFSYDLQAIALGEKVLEAINFDSRKAKAMLQFGKAISDAVDEYVRS